MEKHEETRHEETSEEIKKEAEVQEPAQEEGNTEQAEAQAQEEGKEAELSDLEKAELAASEAKDKYLRLYSEFENFRRRTAKERIETVATASRDVIEDLLPILDDFERASQSSEDEKATVESIKEGIDLIQQKLNRALTQKGLKKMEIKAGDKFDDEFHEAITQIPAEKKLEGKIVDVVEPGYFLNQKVIRFAKVVIGAKQ